MALSSHIRIAAIGMAMLLSACESSTLLELNSNFVALSEAHVASASRLRGDNGPDAASFSAAFENVQVAFAENGDKAVVAAKMAESAQMKVSFLNIAVRSYLKSGPVADHKIVDLTRQGIGLCKTEALSGLNSLPVTCGYFHLVGPQAVANAELRSVKFLESKAKRLDVLRQANRLEKEKAKLSISEGIELDKSARSILDQIESLDKSRNKINWDAVDPNFKIIFDRQSDIFICNASDIAQYIKRFVRKNSAWDREKAKESITERMNSLLSKTSMDTLLQCLP